MMTEVIKLFTSFGNRDILELYDPKHFILFFKIIPIETENESNSYNYVYIIPILPFIGKFIPLRIIKYSFCLLLNDLQI